MSRLDEEEGYCTKSLRLNWNWKKFATHGRLEQMRIFLEIANLSEFL